MFVTPPSTPFGGFLENLSGGLASRLRAAWLNYVGGQFPNALDAIGGGYYQFVGDDIRLSSDTKQVKINAPSGAHHVELRGFVTIGLSDDVNYATGVGTLTISSPATFTAGITYSGAVTFSNTVQFDGAVTVNAATTCTSDGDITLQSGCTVTGQSGSMLTMDSGSTTTINGATTLAGTNTISGTTTVSGTVALTNRRQLRRTRVVLSDADQSVNVGQGDRFLLPASNAAPRIITLTSTGTVPLEGESLEFLWHPAGGGGGGTQYTFRREDTTVVATFVGSTAADTGTVFAEYEFTEGVWKLARSSGTPYDGVASYGTVPGAGA